MDDSWPEASPVAFEQVTGLRKHPVRRAFAMVGIIVAAVVAAPLVLGAGVLI